MKALLLLCFCAVAQAAPLPETNIANMVAQNDQVMNEGLCAVANGAKPSKTEIMFVGKQKISALEAWKIASANYVKNKKTGKYLMSERLATACRKDRDSDGCIYARARWSQEPLSVHPPGDLK